MWCHRSLGAVPTCTQEDLLLLRPEQTVPPAFRWAERNLKSFQNCLNPCSPRLPYGDYLHTEFVILALLTTVTDFHVVRYKGLAGGDKFPLEGKVE